MNSITEFLDLEDASLVITDTSISGTTKTITLETRAFPHYCPLCQYRMYSKGIKQRKIRHPILQDNYDLVLLLKQRRWKCTNSACGYTSNEEFHFVSRRRRLTNAADILIVQAFRDFFLPATAIAERFHTSDTNVMDIFDRYVSMDRLPLSDIISVDEVCIDIDSKCRYALMIQDFYTHDPIDLLISRRADTTEPYFVSIPLEERAKVRYLISDMYNPYLGFVDKYFPNAVSVVDSFHVVQWMITRIDQYIRQLLKDFKKRDRDAYNARHPENTDPHVVIPQSEEVYLLTKYRWLILANQSNIEYHADLRMDKHLHRMMNTQDYEDSLFRINPRLETLRDLKERYISFNNKYGGDPVSARPALEKLIEEYRHSGEPIFIDFAGTLTTYKEPIINSFVMIQKNPKNDTVFARLSNGPIESINRVPKDMKRNGRGYRSFDHFRNRFLFAMRTNPPIHPPAQYTPPLTNKADHEQEN